MKKPKFPVDIHPWIYVSQNQLADSGFMNLGDSLNIKRSGTVLS
ncbi:hypothetical protein [Okeania sp. SIO2B3]